MRLFFLGTPFQNYIPRELSAEHLLQDVLLGLLGFPGTPFQLQNYIPRELSAEHLLQDVLLDLIDARSPSFQNHIPRELSRSLS